MNRIDIRFIPQSEMRPEAPGIGDWFWEGETLHVRAVTGQGVETSFLVALHEMVEAVLCNKHGVSEAAVDAFDAQFELEEHGEDDEPGDDPRAPYRAEHRQAMLIEMLMANFLGLTDYGVIR